MKDITQDFGTLFHPVSALVIYQTKKRNNHTYVEHFDMDKNGNPVNAHPLTEREAKRLAKALHTEKEKNREFLKSNGILPTTVLHISPGENGSVLWYTKTRQTQLFFAQSLKIESGPAQIPALLWFANKQSLMVFALATDRRPTENTPLYHSPFFNVYTNGNVCMGTVDVNTKNSISLEEFIQAWENCFFNSYFSHLVSEHNPIKGNCINLWKGLINTDKPFPKEVLKKTDKTLKNLLK